MTRIQEGEVYIYGRHPVMEAISHRKDIVRAVYIPEDSKDEHLKQILDDAGIAPQPLHVKQLPGELSRDVVHQGVVACISERALVGDYKTYIETVSPTPDTSLLLLGEVQDPHNVGALIRSAAAFGISAVLIPPHNQAHVTGVVAKVSAGMVFRVPLVAISNVNTAIRDLQSRGYWTYGLDGRADTSVTEEVFDRPTVFVVGNEGKGLRKVTAEVCDTLISIPMHERCESMNAATSAAVMLYAWSAQHGNALKV